MMCHEPQAGDGSPQQPARPLAKCGVLMRYLPLIRSLVSGGDKSMHRELKYEVLQDFPGRPVVKNLHFHCRGHRFYHWSGN